MTQSKRILPGEARETQEARQLVDILNEINKVRKIINCKKTIFPFVKVREWRIVTSFLLVYHPCKQVFLIIHT